MYALIALAVVEASAAIFAPPLDRPIPYTFVETRTDDRGTLTFAIDRRVTFERRPGGYRATVETLRVDGSAGGGIGAIFQSATADMIGRPIRILLDERGRVIGVEDRDAEWTRQIAALDHALAGGSAARQATVASLIAPMRTLDASGKTRRIAEVLEPLLGSALLQQGAFAERPASLAGDGPAGPVTLDGKESQARMPDGGVTYNRRVAGPAMDLSERRHVGTDGLARESVETRIITIGTRRLTITRRTAIT